MKKIMILILSIVLISCDRNETDVREPDAGPMVIYKTRQDYSQYMPISLTADKSMVSYYPGQIDSLDRFKPIALIDNYHTASIWLDYVYTDVRRDDWNRIMDSIPNNVSTPDYLYSHIIDFDPIIEFYVDYNRIIDYSPDTLFLNDIIRKKELTKYFERLK